MTDDELRESVLDLCQAMKLLAQNPKTIAEPSGAVSLAGFLFRYDQLPKTKLNVAIISGGNIEPAMLRDSALKVPFVNLRALRG